MYNFIMLMWVMGRFDEEKVQSYVPKFISQAQANDILATPKRA